MEGLPIDKCGNIQLTDAACSPRADYGAKAYLRRGRRPCPSDARKTAVVNAPINLWRHRGPRFLKSSQYSTVNKPYPFWCDVKSGDVNSGIGVDKPILHKPAGQTLSAEKAMDFIMLRSIAPPLLNDVMSGDTEQAFASVNKKRRAILSNVVAVSLANCPKKGGRH